MRRWNSNEFLEYVGTYVRLVDGKAEPIPEDEIEGQLTLPFEQTQKPVFTRKIDLVIAGGCEEAYRDKATLQVPMGALMKTFGKEDEPDQSWLHAVITRNNACTVLIFPICCGSYGKQYEDLIRQACPAVEFLFPPVHDLYDNVHSRLDQLCQHLIDAGMMVGED
jgi:hypothetical protein